MRVERDIAGFALPFAAGIMAATLPMWNTSGHICVIFPILLAVPMTLLMHPWHRSMSPGTVRAVMTAAAFLCGLVTGIPSIITEVSTAADTDILSGYALSCGRRMQEAINDIPFSNRSTNALINALLTGERQGIPEKITATFRKSGVSHILALSGLHLGIIYGIIRGLQKPLGNSPGIKRTKSFSAVTFCTLYTLATGAGPSIVRALLFIVIREASTMSGRYGSLKQTLYVSLILHLVISPLSIRSIGFQLSYAAMAGITFIYPRLKGLWPDRKGQRYGVMHHIWNTASISISCQLTTAPLAWLYFRSLPEYFLLTNMIALPLTSLIIPSAIATTFLHHLEICPDIVTRATEGLVQTLAAALETISSM